MDYINSLVFYTDRLILRPYTFEDAENVYPVISKREIAEMTINIPHPYPLGTVQWWINFTLENIKKGAGFEFGIFLKENHNRYIGNCGLTCVVKEHKNAELCYFMDPGYWNRGLTTEAVKKIIRFGFEELGLERISGRCMDKNTGSKKVMEKCGLKCEGMARHEIYKWGRFEDVARYGMIRSDLYY